MDTVNPALVARAYTANIQNQAARISGGDVNATGGEDSQGGGSGGGVSFSPFLKQQVDDSVQALRGGEELAARAVTEEADITDVVQAVTNAEVTLQTVVAVRDRMVSAYQEIMRMPI